MGLQRLLNYSTIVEETYLKEYPSIQNAYKILKLGFLQQLKEITDILEGNY